MEVKPWELVFLPWTIKVFAIKPGVLTTKNGNYHQNMDFPDKYSDLAIFDGSHSFASSPSSYRGCIKWLKIHLNKSHFRASQNIISPHFAWFWKFWRKKKSGFFHVFSTFFPCFFHVFPRFSTFFPRLQLFLAPSTAPGAGAGAPGSAGAAGGAAAPGARAAELGAAGAPGGVGADAAEGRGGGWKNGNYHYSNYSKDNNSNIIIW